MEDGDGRSRQVTVVVVHCPDSRQLYNPVEAADGPGKTAKRNWSGSGEVVDVQTDRATLVLELEMEMKMEMDSGG